MKEEKELKNQPGAPLGNQNARKHGFYSSVLDKSQQLDLEEAISVHGLDDEIALLRVKIKTLVQTDPDNVRLIVRAIDSMSRLVKIKYNIGGNDKVGLTEAIGNVLKDIALPVGTGIINILKK